MEAIIVLFTTGLISMFLGAFNKPKLVVLLAVLGLGFAAYVQHFPLNFLPDKYNLLSFEGNGNAFVGLALFLTAMVILAGYSYFKADEGHTGDFVSLLLFSVSGAVILVGFKDMFMFFLGVEILSIPLYVLVGSKKKNALSSEAAIKYFFTGAFATSLMLFGIALIYGASGSFKLDEIYFGLQIAGYSPMLYVGVTMLLASILFKVGAFPFHFWVADVYEGSPNIFMGYMASVVKLVMSFAFVKLFTGVFEGISPFWTGILAVSIVVSMFIGNLSALRQTKFKRLMAFSSITNSAYVLMAVLSNDPSNIKAIYVFLLGYGASVVAMVVISLMLDDESDELANYKGIGYKNPIVGIVATIALLSMAGIPPLTGFIGKVMLFSSVYENYLWLVGLALLNSAIGVYFYVRMIMNMLSKDETEVKTLSVDWLQYSVLIICGVVIAGGWSIIACWH